MPSRVLPKTRSVYRLLVSITVAIVMLSFLLIGSIFYWKVLTPIETEVFAEATRQMRYNLDMRLESKEDSVVSIAQSLARQKMLVDGLRDQDRSQLLEAIQTIGSDYAKVTCRVSTGWMSYNYLKSQYLLEGCKSEILEFLQPD